MPSDLRIVTEVKIKMTPLNRTDPTRPQEQTSQTLIATAINTGSFEKSEIPTRADIAALVAVFLQDPAP